jgi:catechol 2,3-dioxygenase-like lactoylglutathione lyase family enzyme
MRIDPSGIVLDSLDGNALADFYHRLLGWPLRTDEPGWVTLRPPYDGPGLSFASEAAYVPPTWPTVDGRQQMMVHLDFQVDDLEAAGAHALAQGARLAGFQPQEFVRVYLDPAGHPFCLWVMPPSAQSA